MGIYPEARLEALMADYQSLLEGNRLLIFRGQLGLRLSQLWPMTTFNSDRVDVAIMEVEYGGTLG